MESVYKLLLFDLDDTLLDSKKSISDRTLSAILKAHDKGIQIGYVTARSPRKVRELIKKLPCQAIAYYSGAKILVNDMLVAKFGIPFDDGYKLLVELSIKQSNFTGSAHFEPYRYKNNRIYHVSDWIPLGSFSDVEHTDFQRIIIKPVDENGVKAHMTEDMILTITAHGKEMMISHKNANKGNAVKIISKHLNIEMKHIVVFGDDINDINMFNICGTSVAVNNAVIDIKLSADYITDSNDNDGVAKWIESFIHNE